jgi:hypothetical protein
MPILNFSEGIAKSEIYLPRSIVLYRQSHRDASVDHANCEYLCDHGDVIIAISEWWLCR